MTHKSSVFLLPASALLLLACGATSVSAGDLEPQPARFATTDRVQIVGDYFPPTGDNAPAVILLHMYGSDRAAWTPLIPALHDAGFAVLAFDLRGHGESIRPTNKELAERAESRDTGLFTAMHRDVAAAYRFLADKGNVDLTRLGLIGASVGCSVAIDYAARDKSVDVIVCMSPGANYLGLHSVKHILGMKGQPALLLATEDEREAVDRLGKLYPGATGDIVAPGNIHGTRMFGQIEGVESKIVEFLKKHIGDGKGQKVGGYKGRAWYMTDHDKLKADVPDVALRWYSSEAEARARGLEPFNPEKHGNPQKNAK